LTSLSRERILHHANFHQAMNSSESIDGSKGLSVTGYFSRLGDRAHAGTVHNTSVALDGRYAGDATRRPWTRQDF